VSSAPSSAALVALAILCCVAPPAAATPLDAVNAVRASGCGGKPLPALRRSPKLDDAAARLARGVRLHDALPAAGYRANEAVLLHVVRAPGDRELRQLLQQRFCEDLRNAAVRDGGYVRARDELWFVFAAPFDPPAPGDAQALARRAVELVNEARATPRRCGTKAFAAARPVQLSAMLSLAALVHSREMAAGAPFAHDSPTTGTPGARVERTGYRAAIVGENISAGMESVDDTVAGWLNSPGHCANVMEPRYTEMGIAYAVEPSTRYGIFWTQVFATPLATPR
jgi:uncharacterized protein YkwD